ncbi:MAG: lysylphosphatidylglycerol synthase transmembrane domain-containing protein [Bacteroidota bacterium]|nr:lysylphosphatidylglycerol synthase transmembrane domain-containing protein [Bacteroidota bacterium]
MKKILQVLISLLLAAFLFWLVYRNMDFSKLADVFRSGLCYWWILASVVFNVLSNVLRGLMWSQLVKPVCPEVRKKSAILAVFVSYAANLLFPRAGEVVRCGVLKKQDGASFSKTFGTVITERILDMLCLLLIAVLAVVLQIGFFNKFFHENPDSLARVLKVVTSPYIWGSLATLVVAFFLLKKWFKQTPFLEKTRILIRKIWDGMKSIKTLERPFVFIVYIILIWVLYFLMFYVGRFFFPFDIPLGFLPMLGAFVMGSLGILAPVQGGIGAYHFMVIYTLTFFGIGRPEAAIFALVIHGLQTIQSLLFGLIAWLWLSAEDHKKRRITIF